jgi:hypothetical protein
MVRPERFELPTCCSGGNRSIQLSYGRTRVSTVYMGGGNRFNANLRSGRVRSTWTATFVPTIQAPGLHIKAALAGQRCRRNEPRLLGPRPGRHGSVETVDGRILSNLVAVAPPTTAAAPATTISAVAAASSATAAAGTFRLGARLIDVDRASAD